MAAVRLLYRLWEEAELQLGCTVKFDLDVTD